MPSYTQKGMRECSFAANATGMMVFTQTTIFEYLVGRKNCESGGIENDMTTERSESA